VLYCLFVIGHGRRRVLHFSVTRHPTSTWIVQQLRETFPYQWAPSFLIFKPKLLRRDISTMQGLQRPGGCP
jgi:hypothetical protein